MPQNTCGSCGFIGPAGRSYSGALLLILAARTLFANAEGATCSGELSLQRSLPPRSLPYHVLFLPQWVSPALAVFLYQSTPVCPFFDCWIFLCYSGTPPDTLQNHVPISTTECAWPLPDRRSEHRAPHRRGTFAAKEFLPLDAH